MAGLAVVLDTNVLLSGLAYPASVPGRLIAAWRFGALEVVLSEFILAELRRTLPRLAHRHGLTPEAIDDLIETMAILAELVEPEAVEESDLTDRDDLPVLGTLLAALRLGLAQTLVTGDKALLSLRDRYPIRTPAEFWKAHGGL
ncbi:MAG: putative toxin-antitoxin system toxin component, PIN family [Cyanobium sp. 49614_E6]|jgi:putative PIN family toxin of toxin-antitoxin system|nr:putative toxin-antitoxin system toxin component, PIN family [Cyanobium sp. 49614_E6]